ncbi:hypothetical protein B0T26DRAFT_164637 [Lasiosphaeria miniovina]|uniref:Uncharacterized protein n=1 Tax=Lasiosphaeria miniovina TaxID=1954250 RepID=A0AA40B5Y8_9PEZI|nr:uncharacterized protein B0T26DRAFT_164637 [Lasiosphaeria miniovina]KAK0728233.1 hypothetical protein B0T26DRAFT_164637 [Lasiosphaeria miniovina]
MSAYHMGPTRHPGSSIHCSKGAVSGALWASRGADTTRTCCTCMAVQALIDKCPTPEARVVVEEGGGHEQNVPSCPTDRNAPSISSRGGARRSIGSYVRTSHSLHTWSHNSPSMSECCAAHLPAYQNDMGSRWGELGAAGCHIVANQMRTIRGWLRFHRQRDTQAAKTVLRMYIHPSVRFTPVCVRGGGQTAAKIVQGGKGSRRTRFP